jgi:hypothetical protein
VTEEELQEQREESPGGSDESRAVPVSPPGVDGSAADTPGDDRLLRLAADFENYK